MINLHVFPLSPRSFKVLAVANHLGLEYQQRLVDLTKGGHNAPEFVALNPNKRVPVLEENGFVLWESNAILQYLASKRPESGLLPVDSHERAQVTQWQCWDLAHWDAASAIMIFERVVKKLLSIGEADEREAARGEERFHRCAQVLDQHLRDRKFVVGNALTVADFSIGATLNAAVPARLPIERYAHIRRWHAELSELPAWRKAAALAM